MYPVRFRRKDGSCASHRPIPIRRLPRQVPKGVELRVFISHASADKAAVEALAADLKERGFEPWFDIWKIHAGEDVVGRINEGLEKADAGIVVFSKNTDDHKWVAAETSYMSHAHIQDGFPLIPVILDAEAHVPALLRPLAFRAIEQIKDIADGLRNPAQSKRGALPPGKGRVERVRISLRPGKKAKGVKVEVRIADKVYGHQHLDALPLSLLHAREAFIHGVRVGALRNAAAAARRSLEKNLARLGKELRALCLPEGAGQALTELVDGCPLGTLVEVRVEAEGAELLGLPYEALRLPDDRPLATRGPVVMLRQPKVANATQMEPLAGPLKILVAVGAPDEDLTNSQVLDLERELQNILEAVGIARQPEEAEVRILEVGHPEKIADALERDAYHVLHLSCHGRPGALELEDEDGRPVLISAKDLIRPIKSKGKSLPLVLLNACHGGVHEGETASLAESLLRAGIPAVLAMQAVVSDDYASGLAAAFYRHLAREKGILPSRALARARQDLEKARRAALNQGDASSQTQPEYATPALFLAGVERPLVDLKKEKEPLQRRPVYAMAGPVPQLRLDDLIGRRRELRECLRVLRNPDRQFPGVVLTGIGGVGKSALAGRVMLRLKEKDWLVTAFKGRWDLAKISATMGTALSLAKGKESRELGAHLLNPQFEDQARLALVEKALAETRLLLVLDDFEQNLETGGLAFHDPQTREILEQLAHGAQRGRLLITCRYPIPGAESLFQRVALGPLSPAESRKLTLRLPKLAEMEAEALRKVLKMLGGHPRMMEFLDALLRGGKGRLPHVTAKLKSLLAHEDVNSLAEEIGAEEGFEKTLSAGARDVLLEELVAIAREQGLAEHLFQVAVSNLPVSPAGLARMLAESPEQAGDPAAAERALTALEDLALLHRLPDGAAWVHRWTAEGLARLDEEALPNRRGRAGKYRLWRVQHESHALEDLVEAVRNFLAGGHFDAASNVAQQCFTVMRRIHQSMAIAALASEVLEVLPETHGDFAVVADQEAMAHLALGRTGRAMARYSALLERYKGLSQSEPERLDHQRYLSVFYNKMGDLYTALGKGEEARAAYANALEIAQRLAESEPERADYQRDLSVSYERIGDVNRELGKGEEARGAYANALEIRERLAESEPERADYQRDMIVSLVKMSETTGSEAVTFLKRAHAIAFSMKKAGIMNPTDEWMIQDLKQRIQNLSGQEKPTDP